MAMNLYVGNMSFSTTEDTLREAFAQYGTVTKVQLIMDRETGRPRGFAFVEMSDGADAAIQALNGAQLDGRPLTVNEAKPREDRGPRGGGGGGGGGRASFGGEREMHTVTCANCGKEAKVPFLPRGDKPVYCDDCFQQQRRSSRW